MRIERIGDATLYLGDSREVLPQIEPVDALVTDPPYGVGFTGKVTKHTINRPSDTYEDTEEYFRAVVMDVVRAALEKSNRAAIFCGTRRLHEYPVPADIGGIICPNGGGRSSWGFGCYHPVLFYGKSPHIAAGLGARPTAAAIYHPGMHVTGERDGNDHPCPKPLAFMDWALGIATFAGETVLDPFMGSGTTGVSCKRLGRKFVGIEREARFFDIACRRLSAANGDDCGPLFGEAA